MAATPRFVLLVKIDQQRFFTACRHGVVHLTWGRATLRLSRDELRLLAELLECATDPLSLSTTTTSRGGICITFDPGGESEVGLEDRGETWLLRLGPSEFQRFHRAARDAAKRLEEILSTGMWDEVEAEEEEPTPNPLALLRRNSFSRN